MTNEDEAKIKTPAEIMQSRGWYDIMRNGGMQKAAGSISNAESLQAAIERAVESLRKKWNAPQRHVEFDAIKANKWAGWMSRYNDLCRTLDGNGRMIALIGERAVGKTQMAVELMRFVTAKRHTCYFDTAAGFYRMIKATYGKLATETEKDVIERFTSYRLLVLDELGKTGATDWEACELFEMINLRYNAKRDTLLISNQNESAFAETIGPSLVRRLNETGGIITCNWE